MNAMQRNTMITTNGAATRMVRLCRPDRASSPPTSSMMIATAPITEPQKITTHLRRLVRAALRQRAGDDRRGVGAGDEEDRHQDHDEQAGEGRPRVGLEHREQLLVSVSAAAGSRPACCWVIAAPPKIENQTRLTRLGTRITPPTNWRIVRPRLILARNMPTKGVQEIHHAQ